MLVITRRITEGIIVEIGDFNIEITVLAIRGWQVRLGIKAPKDIKVHRQEIYLRAQQAELEE